MIATPETLLEGLVFPEGPRWYGDRLWLADMHGHRVLTVDLQGNSTHIAAFDDKPSGIGLLADGTPIVVSMRKRLLVRIAPDGSLSTYADLNVLPGDSLNDMVMDGHQRAYVGNRIARGYSANSLQETSGPSAEGVVLVTPDGRIEEVARDLWSPNGSVVTPDNRTLIVAEARGCRLIAFDIEEDGTLGNRRLFADTGDANPDGIALDAEGAIWIGSPRKSAFYRILPGGKVAAEIKLPEGKWAVACALGGPDRRTLFMLTAYQTMENLAKLVDFEADKRSTSRGFVEVVTVDVPGAGWP